VADLVIAISDRVRRADEECFQPYLAIHEGQSGEIFTVEEQQVEDEIDKRGVPVFERARNRADAHAEEIIDIVDNSEDDVIRVTGPRGNEIVIQNTVGVQRAKLRMQARQWLVGKVQPEKYGDIKTIRDERHPLDSMAEEQKMAATLELIAKVKARLDQARALGLLPPKVEDAEFEDVPESGE
jgi:hypothetical protein